MAEQLGELFRIARQYGRVSIYTMDNGCYHASIKFNTIKHTELEAKSDFKSQSPEDAVRQAVKAAQEIVDSIGKMSVSFPERKLLA